ncbi:bifunctional farnesyl-diphosphate farnesyltransferase/squalene synthase [Podila verticillata]|nr:bifunctional farnesyl-diphosphate farnesyltransferase/squalene synthase [Podila verticillata]
MTTDLDTKISYLKPFHKLIYQEGWNFTKSGPDEKDRQLLLEFDTVISAFLQLKPGHQEIIADITRRMGAGMARYATAGINVETIAEYNEYCHIVAGLVGLGLSDLFSSCGYVSAMLASRNDLSNSMGLFLQKTNIIVDYLEDLRDKRFFWPKEIRHRYCQNLGDLIRPENKNRALQCLNDMLFIAMAHIEDVLEYLSMVKSPSCFKFCALPQVMAIATLSLLCGNYKVFTHEHINIRRGEAIWLMKESNNIDTVAAIFRLYIRRIKNKITPSDPQFADIGITCGEIEQNCKSKYPASTDELKRLQTGVMAGLKGNVSKAAGVIAGTVIRKNTLK